MAGPGSGGSGLTGLSGASDSDHLGAIIIKKIIRGLLFAVCILAATYTSGMAETPLSVAPYRIELFSDGSGIPTGEANAVLQTADGYLWFGSYGGLIRYDGTSFEQYSGTRGLSSYSIRSLWEDEDGTLWVGSNEQGAFCYNGSEFCQPEGDGTRYASVRCFAQAADGTVWMGTADGLAYVEDGAVCGFDLSAFGLENSVVYTLSRDGEGLLWAVDYSGSVLAVDPVEKTVPYVFSPGDVWGAGLYAYSALCASDGRLYIGTNTNRVLILDDPTRSRIVTVVDTGALSSVNSICETQSGAICLCGDAGLGIIDDDGFHDYSNLEYTTHLGCVIEDYERGLWIASSKYGVLHASRSKVSQLTSVPELSDRETYSICRDGNRYYVGYEEGLLVLNESMDRIESVLSDTLSGTPVRAIISGSDGLLYIGTYFGGLVIYDPQTDEILRVTVNDSRCRCELELSDGRVAVGTNSGVVFVQSGAVVETVDTGVGVLCMLESADGTLLCGTDGSGILSVSDGKASVYADPSDGLSGGVILRIRQDAVDPEMLWVSCGNDVFFGGSEGFSPTTALPEGSGSVLDIFPVGDTVWFFRSSGILQCRRGELLDPSGSIDPLMYCSSGDGLPAPIVANSFSWFDGTIFAICTTDGICILDTENFYQNDAVPKARISDVLLSDGTVWDGSDRITVSKDLSRITFRLSALTYGSDDAQIEYRLEGLDTETIVRSVSEQHDIEYTNLSAGTYIFSFHVTNSDGISGNEQQIVIVKKPKFTETLAFPISLAALVAFLLWFVSWLRARAAKNKQRFYKQFTDQIVSTISGAIDAKDPYTEGHSRRVADFSEKIGRRLGLDDKACEQLHYTALLHDIGKIGVPDNILKKPGRLTDEEFDVIRQHTVAGGEILSNLTLLPGIAEGALYHHEKYNGSGYCNGLAGADIPLYARIIAVADAFDAMTSSRCYRKAMAMDTVLEEIEKGRGTQFDPELADLALEIIREEGLTEA